MINIKKILCPVDFFPASDAAVNYAAGLAANYEAEIHLLHVITPIVMGAYEYAIDATEFVRSMMNWMPCLRNINVRSWRGTLTAHWLQLIRLKMPWCVTLTTKIRCSCRYIRPEGWKRKEALCRSFTRSIENYENSVPICRIRPRLSVFPLTCWDQF